MGARNDYLMEQFDGVKGELHVLIVDDNPDISLTTEMYLNAVGVPHTHVAGNGAQALDVMEHDAINVVVTDLDMPVMNGMELLQRIRGSKEFQDVPVIMISGQDQREGEAVAKGVTRFMVKPVDPADLEQAIARASVGAPGAQPS